MICIVDVCAYMILIARNQQLSSTHEHKVMPSFSGKEVGHLGSSLTKNFGIFKEFLSSWTQKHINKVKGIVSDFNNMFYDKNGRY